MNDDDKKDDDDFEEIIENFDDDDLEFEDDSFDDFDSQSSSLGSTLKENPIVKAVIIIAIIVAIIAVIFFLQEDAPTAPSLVPQPSEVLGAPGESEVSEVIREATEEADEQRREAAEITGGSALPTPLEPPVGRIQLPEDDTEEEDPLQRWRRLQQERIEREAERSRLLQPEALQDDGLSAQAVQDMADRMAEQMEIILEEEKTVDFTTMSITSADYLETLAAAEAARNQEQDAAGANNGNNISEILVPAGEILYAQLLLEANSDIPGPVLAQIAGGPLNGARALGSFQVQKKYLVLTFNTVVVDGISQRINAIAIDPGTTLTGIATEVDHRYFTRIILPTASAFIQGAAEAVANTGRTTITLNNAGATSTEGAPDTKEEIASGIEEAAEEIGDIIDDIADNTETLIRIERGTPIGLLLLNPVLKER